MEGGGAERQLAYLAKELVRQGCEVHVAMTRGGSNLSRLESSGATVHHLGPASSRDLRILSRLRRILATVQPSIVQCWLLQMELLGGLAATAAGIPWLFAERSSVNAYPRTLKNYLRVRAASFASAIVANSIGGDQYWREKQTGVPRYVVNNALPLEEIRATPAATADDLQTRSGEVCVLYAGRLDAGKNADVLIRALAMVRSTKRVQAVLCGDGPLRAHLERLIREHGMQDRVRLAGYVQNLWSLLKSVDVLVSPSRFEGSPNIVLEAMACGCPLVVSDIPAHREILDEHAALFADPDDARGFADRIDQTLDRPDLAAERARIAQARTERYDLPQVALQYLTVYRDVLARRGRSSRRVA
jgi:Glycosyltransferase